jgi:hypothetical protein
VRLPRLDISVPEFPVEMEWINAPFVRIGTLLGRNAVLVWFWDCASLNALRALPYVKEWDRRYARHGLRVLGVHSPQFDFGHSPAVVSEAVGRLRIPFAVAHDADYEVWKAYGNEVWPALYLWDRRGLLRYYHFAEGAYEETETAIQELLREIEEEVELPAPMAPLRASDRPGVLVQPPTAHRYVEPDRSAREIAAGDTVSLRYAGAAATAVLDGQGEVEVLLDGEPTMVLRLEGPRLYELHESPRHEEHELELRFRDPARAYAFSFAAGIA